MTITPGRLLVAVGCLLAVTGPMALGTRWPDIGDLASFVVRLCTALLAMWLLLRRAPAGKEAPRTSSRLFAAGLAVGAAAAALAVLSSAGLVRKEVADVVYLGHVPFVVAGLLFLPVQDAGVGARMRAVLDGLVAATALAFVLHLTVPAVSGSGSARILLFATADVFLLAAMLSMQPRVLPQLRRYLFLTSAGLLLMGIANLQKAIALTDGPVSSHGVRTAVVELGVLLIVLAARHPVQEGQRTQGWRWSALGPFLPSAVGAVMVLEMVATGGKLGGLSLQLGILNSLALLVRQAVVSWDTAQLQEHLRQREHAYRDQALQDLLTGLPNRRAFLAHVDEALANGVRATLLLVDCDDFKLVNDTQGHDAGDAVLRHVGRQMQAAVGRRGFVARLGGDEFGVLVHGGADEAQVVARELRSAAGAPLQVGARRTSLTVSVGGATTRRDGDDVSSLLAHADVALYRSKDGAGRGVTLLDEQGRLEAAARLRLRDEVASPDLERFSIAFQPLFDATSERLHSVEALLRWDHPELGAVSPDVFIPLAEQTGSIALLGDLVLDQGLRQLAAWRTQQPVSPVRLSINVSPQQLADPDFSDRVLSKLSAWGVDPALLIVEVAEHDLTGDLAPLTATVRGLRAAGVRVAVDDFGTGCASLRYLERLPTDVVKVDRSCTAAMSVGAPAVALVSGLLALARELGLMTVVKGVETREQLAVLRDLGCDVVQGFLLAHPMSAEEVSALLDRTALAAGSAGPVRVPLPRRARLSLAHSDRGTAAR